MKYGGLVTANSSAARVRNASACCSTNLSRVVYGDDWDQVSRGVSAEEVDPLFRGFVLLATAAATEVP